MSVTIEGQTIAGNDSRAFILNLAPGDHRISGTYSNGFIAIAFGEGVVGKGGVRSGSMTNMSGVQPLAQTCGGLWGDEAPRSESFSATFTVTADSSSACKLVVGVVP